MRSAFNYKVDQPMKFTYLIATIRFSVLQPAHTPNPRSTGPKGFYGAVQSIIANKPFETIVTLYADLSGNGSIDDLIQYLNAVCSGKAVIQGTAEVLSDGCNAVSVTYSHTTETWVPLSASGSKAYSPILRAA